MPTAQVNRQRLYYEDTGGDGPAVVFSHGFLMDADMFRPQLDDLGAEYRCIAWDERGFGRTEHDGQPFTYYDSAADVVGLLDHLGIDSAVWAGMSQGGFLSLRGALTYPERVRALVLIGTQAGVEDEAMLPGYQAMADEWAANGPTGVAPGVAGLIIGDQEIEPEWIAKWHAMPNAAITVPFDTLIGRDDMVEQLGSIAQPALVVHGEADLSIPIEKAELLCERLPDCRGLVRVPGAAHAANLTHPEVVNPAIRSFLASLVPAAA